MFSLVRCGGAGVDSDSESYFTVAYAGMRNGHCRGQSLLPLSYIKQYPVYYAGPAKAVEMRMCFSKHFEQETDRFTQLQRKRIQIFQDNKISSSF